MNAFKSPIFSVNLQASNVINYGDSRKIGKRLVSGVVGKFKKIFTNESVIRREK